MTEKITIIIPVYNQAWTIVPFLKKWQKELDQVNSGRHAFLFVDNGSDDKSPEILSELVRKNSEVQVVTLEERFSDSQAIQTGFDYAQGEYLITLDLKTLVSPQDCWSLIEALEKDGDVAVGKRINLKRPLRGRMIRLCISWLVGRISGLKLVDYDCSIRAYKKSIVTRLHLPGELHNYIPAMLSWRGHHIVEVDVNAFDNSENFSVLEPSATAVLKTILDLIFLKYFLRQSARPFHFFGGIGVVSLTLSILCLVTAVSKKLILGLSLIDSPLPLMATLFFLLSIMLVALGVTVELFVQLSRVQSGREFYRVKNTNGLEN
jgi:glycosyltransferase involved in cell wall biosynthesis